MSAHPLGQDDRLATTDRPAGAPKNQTFIAFNGGPSCQDGISRSLNAARSLLASAMESCQGLTYVTAAEGNQIVEQMHASCDPDDER